MSDRLKLTRRKLLALGATLPLGALIAACGGRGDTFSAVQEAIATIEQGGDLEQYIATATAGRPEPTPEPTATPEPFIVAAGEERRMLMRDTRYETPLYIFGTGRPGPVLAVLSGVHGNEPGAWHAAERLLETTRPDSGAFLLLPHANREAIALFQRTTDELGDLNRLYPGDPEGLPMARMAYEIVAALQEFRASLVIDMHESWGFFSDRSATQSGPAFLGQSMSSRGELGDMVGAAVAERVNSEMILWPQEELHFRAGPPASAFPGPTPAVVAAPGAEPAASPGGPGTGGAWGGRSSLGIPNYVPGASAMLVEMGQQQEMERRIQLHVDVVRESMRVMGIL